MRLSKSYRLSLREWRNDDNSAGWGFVAFPNGRKENTAAVIRCGDAFPSKEQAEQLAKLVAMRAAFIVRFTSLPVAIEYFTWFAEMKRVADQAAELEEGAGPVT
jgi:hypothetical protein